MRNIFKVSTCYNFNNSAINIKFVPLHSFYVKMKELFHCFKIGKHSSVSNKCMLNIGMH